MTSEHGVLHSFSSVREPTRTQQMVEPMGSRGLHNRGLQTHILRDTNSHKYTKSHTPKHQQINVLTKLCYSVKFHFNGHCTTEDLVWVDDIFNLT